MPKIILGGFLFYLATVTITQTAHGGNFMSLRWIGLAGLAGASAVYWLLGFIPRRDALGNVGPGFMFWIYLLGTLASIVVAQNMIFSGLKWVSQATLLITFMFLLRGTFHSGTAGQMIWIIKGITIFLLGLSFFYPAPATVYDNPYYRGAMGDSNSLGHIAMLCALLYFHGSIISFKAHWKLLQFGIALVATGIMVSSWARSSMVGFLVGLALLSHFYGLTRSLLAKSAALLLICFLLASPIMQSGILDFLAKDRETQEPEQSSKVLAVIKGDMFKKSPSFETVIRNRSSLWLEAWKGFKKRPFLGWGFGATQDIPMRWAIRPTSIGLVRDITNDILFILEGSGIIGFLGYFGLMILILKQSLGRQQIIRTRRNSKERLMKGEAPILSRPQARDHQHAILYIISISLFALFQTDGSAFSAGSLISAIFWICAGAAGALRAEAVASERGMNPIEQEVPKTAGPRVRLRNPKWEGGRL